MSRRMGSLAKCPATPHALALRGACLLWRPPPAPQIQEETWRLPGAAISFSIAGFLSRAQHGAISPKSCVLTSLSSPLNLPGARLSSRLFAKRHLLKYSSAETVPWVLFLFVQLDVMRTGCAERKWSLTPDCGIHSKIQVRGS